MQNEKANLYPFTVVECQSFNGTERQNQWSYDMVRPAYNHARHAGMEHKHE
jgi:hypothetical protein